MSTDCENFDVLRQTLDRFVRQRLTPREKEVDGPDQPLQDLLDESAASRRLTFMVWPPSRRP